MVASPLSAGVLANTELSSDQKPVRYTPRWKKKE